MSACVHVLDSGHFCWACGSQVQVKIDAGRLGKMQGKPQVVVAAEDGSAPGERKYTLGCGHAMTSNAGYGVGELAGCLQCQVAGKTLERRPAPDPSSVGPGSLF